MDRPGIFGVPIKFDRVTGIQGDWRRDLFPTLYGLHGDGQRRTGLRNMSSDWRYEINWRYEMNNSIYGSFQ
tara:strand:- start:1852 stop:2064 length:213 start_codon:yes stop_codon:yes gene_type:complete